MMIEALIILMAFADADDVRVPLDHQLDPCWADDDVWDNDFPFWNGWWNHDNIDKETGEIKTKHSMGESLINCNEDFKEKGIDHVASSGLDWALGGWLAPMLVIVSILLVYLKWHKATYALFVGLAWLPFIHNYIPEDWFMLAIILAGVAVGIALWDIVIHRSRA